MASICIVCGGAEFGPAEHATVGRTPYLSCNNCGLWAQYPPPDFRWESELQPESGKAAMHEYARLLNDDLAERLIQRHHPQNVLDIGSKYPYFLHCFKQRGVENVLGIDGCEEAIEYGQELDVPMIVGDFLEHDFGDQKFDLITLVHCIEHFSDPRVAIRKIRDLLTERGVIYIRTPEVGQSGIGLHLSEEHYAVHPLVFSKASFHLLARQEGLHIFGEWEQSEVGQIDWQLRKAEDVRISFCVTSCNEEEVIGRMLESITPLAWELIVYLNNCSDKTPNIIQEWSKRTGIKHRIIGGHWDNNFARAKNIAIMKAEGTHVAWMDCDDVLSADAPEKILALLAEKPDHPQDWRLIYGGDTFFHLRLWKNEGRPYKPHFHDRCHEYVQLGGYQGMKLKCDNITLRHLPKPKDASGRNIIILQEAVKAGPRPCSHCDGELDGKGRTLFYLGNALREAARHEEALECYDTYLDEGLGWHDERFWAWMYKGHNHNALNQPQKALAAWCQAIAANSHWAEPFMAIARAKYEEKKWQEAIAWAIHAAAQSTPNTLMFLNTGAYKDQPWRLMSWCWEHMGNLDKAIQHAEIASDKIGAEDKDWNDRTARMRAKRSGKSVETAKSQEIAQVMRPGALGDIIMSTAACKKLKEAGLFVRYVCHPGSIEAIADNPYVDEIVAVPENDWQKILEHTKELPEAKRLAFFQYPMNEGYPDIPMRQHLAHFFCEQANVGHSTDLSIGLVQEHLDYGAKHGSNKVIIHTTAGWSPLKNWPLDSWAELVAKIRAEGIEVIQIGSEKEEAVLNATKLNTPTIRHAAAVQKFSQMFIGVDSIFNHTSQAVDKRSVILWGSTHPRGSGYNQNINLVNGQVWTRDMDEDPTKDCQPCYREFNSMSVHPKPPCPYLVPHATTTLPEDEYPVRTLNSCMATNTVETVWRHVKELL